MTKSSLFQSLLDSFHSKSSKAKTAPNASRRARIEQLESRELLSATETFTAENYAAMRAEYPALALPVSIKDINVIEISAEDLSVANLKAALATAKDTTADDLIVVRTTDSKNTIQYTDAANAISWASSNGKLNIVAWGEDSEPSEPLTIDANEQARVFTIDSGTVGLANLTFTGGKILAVGGGIYNKGTLTITDSTVSGNRTEKSGYNTYDGGGIFNSGALTITNSTVAENFASSQGAGIYNHEGTLTITNSTVSSNAAENNGGGIGNCGTLTITNSTISNNTAHWGGGIHNTTGKTSNLYNSIVVKNSAEQYNDIYISTMSGAVNGYNTLSSFTNWSSESETIVYNGSDPLFKAGTYELVPNSVARDKGDDSYAKNAGLTVDSKDLAGSSRFYGTIDLGAYEFNPYVVTTLNDSNNAEDAEWSLREAINYAKERDTDKDVAITFSDDLFTEAPTGKITLGSGQLEINRSAATGKTLTIDGAGRVTIDAKQKSRVISVTSNSSVALNGLTITGGYLTSGSGGGIDNSGTLTISNSTVSKNSACSGGGIYNVGMLTITNSTTADNIVDEYGGGIYNGGTLTVTNSTVARNGAQSDGGGIYNCLTLNVFNSIVARNFDGDGQEGSDISNNQTAANGYNTLSSFTAWGNAGATNYEYDANLSLFKDADKGNYELVLNSQAIDKGNDEYAKNAGLTVDSKDLAGNPRFYGASIDLGAYEYNPPYSIVVTTLDDSENPDDGVLSLREAIASAPTNKDVEITFSDDLFTEEKTTGTIALGGKELTINRSAANGKTLTIDGAGRVTIDAKQLSRVISVASNSSVGLNGLTITRGKVTNAGGGIYNEGTLTITNSTVANNSVGEDSVGGGGIYNNGTLTITNSTVANNSVGDYSAGGGIYNEGTLTITNSTVANNTAGGYCDGGGIFNQSSKTLTLYNSVVVNNKADTGDDIRSYGGAYAYNTLSTFNGWSGGSEYIVYNGSDPLFKAGTYELVPNSVARDKGKDEYAKNAGLTVDSKDLAGSSRFYGTIDLGAYEFNPYVVTTLNDSNNATDSEWSLREAINYAEDHDTDKDVAITFSDDLFTEAPTGKITLGGSELSIDRSAATDKTLTIDGAGRVTIDANKKSRVISVTADSSVALNGLTITGGSVSSNIGGGIYNNGTLTITNSTVVGNSALRGGGIDSSGTLTMTNSTVADNAVEDSGSGCGGGIYSSGELNLYNSIVARNKADEDSDIGGGAANGYNTLSAFTDWSNAEVVGVTNYEYDENLPLFKDAAKGNYELVLNSQAIDKGNDEYAKNAGLTVDSKDLAGNQRFYGASIDLGAYEYVPPYSIVVTTLADVEDPDDGVVSLREAIANAPSDRFVEITFSDDLFTEAPTGTITLGGKELTIDRSAANGKTLTIDGAERVTISGDVNEKSRVISVAKNSAVALNGLTITGGYLTSGNGGGIANEGTLTITNSTISKNLTYKSFTYGGGIYSTGTLTITNSSVAGNSCGEGSCSGGGIYSTGNLTITNSSVADNSCGGAGKGGGIYSAGNLTITNSSVADNATTGWGSSKGGGIYNNGTLTITNSTVDDNSIKGGNSYGGGIYNGGTLTITNSTVAGNSINGSSSGGGIYNENGKTSTLYNSIVVKNSASTSCDIYNSNGSVYGYNALSSFNSWVDGGSKTIVYNDSNPLFKEGTYELVANSVARDKGDNTYAANAGLTVDSKDLAGNGRIYGSSIDLGAYEYNPGPYVVTSLEDSVADDNKWTLREALAYAQTHDLDKDVTITFADELFAEANPIGTITLDGSELAINRANATAGKTLTIDGAGRVKIDADGKSRVFNVYNNTTVALDGLTITGGYMQFSTGGGIYSTGTLTITNSTVTKNFSGASGGGVYSSGTLTITNSTVSENTVNSSYGAVDGGGVYSTGTLTITNSTIAQNSASAPTARGGGVSNYGTLTITNSTIADNIATTKGGGIYNNTGKTLMLYNSIVVGNAATSDANISSTAAVVGSNNLSLGVTWASKDANYNYDSEKSLFKEGTYELVFNSQALDKGNDAYAEAAGLTKDSKDLAGKDRFCGSAIDIGAYEYYYSTVVTTLEDSDDLNDGKWTLREAIKYAPDINITITFAEELEGTITLDGTALTLDKSMTIDGDERITISGNTANNKRSRVVNVAKDVVVTLDGLTITGGYISSDVGGIVNQGQLTITNSTVSKNNSDTSTAGIYNATGATLTITNSTVSENSSHSQGGGISNYGTLTVTDSTVSGNKADQGSAGIYNATGATLAITDSTVSDNSTYSQGGGISNYGTLTVTGSTVSGNSASSGGGGIYNASGATLTVTGSTVSKNKSNRLGGGIYNASGVTLTITNSTVSGNNASSGGGIYNNGSLTITDSTVSGNNANNGGGGFYNVSGATLGITNSTISGNSVRSPGAGIYNDGTLTITNAAIFGNTTSTSAHGAGICNQGQLTITNATVSGNSSTSQSMCNGISNIGSATLKLYNSIVLLNGSNGADVYKESNVSVIGYNNITTFTAWTEGEGNKQYDDKRPLFTDVAKKDYSLIDGSQAIDVGSDAKAPTGEYDITGKVARKVDAVDIGAYEFAKYTVTDAKGAPSEAAWSDFSSENKTVKVTWRDNSNDETGFYVEYSSDGGKNWTYKTTLAKSATSYTFSGLQNNASYVFRVKAVKKTDEITVYSALATTTNLDTIPAAPTNVKLEDYDATNETVNITWTDNAKYETGYRVEYTVNGGSNWTLATTTAANATSYKFSGVQVGYTYSFRVCAVNKNGSSDYVQTPTLTPAGAPSNVYWTDYNYYYERVAINWTPSSTGAGTASYRVEYMKNDGAWTLYGTTKVGATSMVVNGLGKADATYKFRVCTVNSGVCSAYSYAANPLVISAAPTDVAWSNYDASTMSVTVSWKDNSKTEEGYRVEYSVDAGVSWMLATTTGADKESATVGSLQVESSYRFRVSAKNNGAYTDYAYAPNPLVISAAPMNATWSKYNASTKRATVSWVDASKLENGYRVEYSVNGGYTWTYITTTRANTKSITVSSLQDNSSYIFRVCAVNVSGGSTIYSAYASTSSLDTIPAAPTNVAWSNYDSKALSVDITWTDNASYEICYVVQYKMDKGSWTTITATEKNATSYTYKDLKTNHEYKFRVYALSVTGASAAVETTEVLKTALPETPTNVAWSNYNATKKSVDITWQYKSTGSTSFTVEYKQDSDDWKVAVTKKGITSYTFKNLEENSVYYFRVCATNESGSSNYGLSSALVPVAAPSDVSWTLYNASSESVTLKWTQNTDKATSYRIEYSKNGGAWTAYKTSASGSASSIDVGKLGKVDATYKFRVCAAYNDACSKWVEASAPLKIASAPTNVKCSYDASNKIATVAWKNNSKAADCYFRVESSIDGGAWTLMTTSTPAASSAKVSVCDDTVYKFRVCAMRGVNETAACSTYATASSNLTTVPTAPTNVAWSSYNETKKTVNITWTDNASYETGYVVQYKMDGGAWTNITTARKNSTSYTYKSLKANHKYVFRVCAKNNAGSSAYVETKELSTYPVNELNSLAFGDESNAIDAFFMNYEDDDELIAFGPEKEETNFFRNIFEEEFV